jgi:hypothetical protein
LPTVSELWALGFTGHEVLAREFILYDALYAECKKQLAATA